MMRGHPGPVEGAVPSPRSTILPFLLAVTLAPAGLAAPRQDGGFDDVRRDLEERTSTSLRWFPARAHRAIEDTSAPHLSTRMNLEDVLQVAVVRNPTLQSTYRELGIARGDLIQAGLLENPSFEATVRFPDDGADEDARNNTEFVITQNVLDFALRKLRRRVADAEYEQTKLRVGAQVLDLIFEVKAAFFELLGATRMLARQEQVLQAAEAAAELSQRQREVGNVSPLDVAVQQAAHQQARIDVVRMQADIVTARENLARMMGLTGTKHKWGVTGEFPELPSGDPGLAWLETMALTRRLDLAAARVEVMVHQRELQLTRASIIPAVNLGVSSERDPEGIRVTGPTLSMDLPFFDRKQGTRLRQRHAIEQSRIDVTGLEQRVLADVRTGFNRLVTARHVADSYRTALLPLQGEVLNQTQLQYNFMLMDVYELLQARQNQILVHREYLRTLTDYWVARAALERSLGAQLPLTDPGSGPSADPTSARPRRSAKRREGGHD